MRNGLTECRWRHAPEAHGGFWEILKNSVSGVETCLGRRRLAFACSRRPLWRVPHVLGVGRWKSQNMYLSPFVEEPLNSKVIKSFVPELRSRKCFSCFEISMFYVIYIYEHYMSISHIYIGLWYNYWSCSLPVGNVSAYICICICAVVLCVYNTMTRKRPKITTPILGELREECPNTMRSLEDRANVQAHARITTEKGRCLLALSLF